MDYNELKDWQDEARHELKREAERLSEKIRQTEAFLRGLEATNELLSQIDKMNEKLAHKQQEIDDLSRQLEQQQADNDALRLQLVEAKEQRLLKAQQATVKTEVPLQPTEIHNHFEPGSSAQVFNSKVTGKFKEKKRWKRIIKKSM